MTMDAAASENSRVESKLQYWSRQLHDMSGRNRLLFWKDSKTSTCTIEEPGFSEVFAALVENGAELAAPLPEPGEVKSIFDSDQDARKPERASNDKLRPLKDNEIRADRSVLALNKVLSNLR